MTDTTKKYKRLKIFLTILDILIICLPLFVYIIIALATNTTVHQKVGLSLSLITALILVLINILLKMNIRCTIWIVLIGIYYCVDSIMPLIFMIAITSVLSEFIIVPLKKKYSNLYVINKEIDKRG